MAQLRRPLFVIALVLMALIVALEVGAHALLTPALTPQRAANVLALPGVSTLVGDAHVDQAQLQQEANSHARPPGLAIPDQALVDGLLLFTVALMGLPLIFPEGFTGRVQGIATLVVTIIVIILGVVLLIVAIAKLVLMVTLFLTPPFGTLIYLVVYGFFDTGRSLAMLTLLMALKLAFCLVLFLAHERFVQNKGLVLLIVTSLVTTIVITFLHRIVPSVLVSITDAIGAIVVLIVAIIWAVVMLVFSIASIVKVLHVDRATGPATSG